MEVDTKQIQRIEAQRDNLALEAHKYLGKQKSGVACDTDVANVFITKLKNGLKAFKADEMSFTRPINEQLKRIRARYRVISEPIEKLVDDLISLVHESRRIKQAAIDEENRKAEAEEERRRKIQAAHEAKGHKVAEDITPVPKAAPLSVTDSTRVRMVWDFAIENEIKIPAEYKTVDLVKVRRGMLAKAQKAKETGADIERIPGVRFFQKEQIY
jgi:uncharacterized protein (UPF0305 family)|tara:strand:+ start:1480 stop:2121 length:642 start_codon:yes stop_codon:yes gene_type:complete